MLPAKACAAALLVFLAASPRDAGAVSADAIRLPPTKAGEVVRQQGPQPLPLSFQHGLAVERTIPITTLDALDVEALLAEDAQSEEITYRLGIGREITADDERKQAAFRELGEVHFRMVAAQERMKPRPGGRANKTECEILIAELSDPDGELCWQEESVCSKYNTLHGLRP